MAQWLSGTRKLNNHFQSGKRKTWYWILDDGNSHTEGDTFTLNSSYQYPFFFYTLKNLSGMNATSFARLIETQRIKANEKTVIKPVLLDANGKFIHRFNLIIGDCNLIYFRSMSQYPGGSYTQAAWEREKAILNNLTLEAPQIIQIKAPTQRLVNYGNILYPTLGAFGTGSLTYGYGDYNYLTDNIPEPKFIVNQNCVVASNQPIDTIDHGTGQIIQRSTEIQNILANVNYNGTMGYEEIIKPTIERTGVI